VPRQPHRKGPPALLRPPPPAPPRASGIARQRARSCARRVALPRPWAGLRRGADAAEPCARKGESRREGDQEGEKVGAGAVLEDHVGEVLLRAAVARRDGALLVVDAVHLREVRRHAVPRARSGRRAGGEAVVVAEAARD
jgi:hypothetical protein